MNSINVIIMIAALAVDYENNAPRAQVWVCVWVGEGIISLPLPGCPVRGKPSGTAIARAR